MDKETLLLFGEIEKLRYRMDKYGVTDVDNARGSYAGKKIYYGINKRLVEIDENLNRIEYPYEAYALNRDGVWSIVMYVDGLRIHIGDYVDVEVNGQKE